MEIDQKVGAGNQVTVGMVCDSLCNGTVGPARKRAGQVQMVDRAEAVDHTCRRQLEQGDDQERSTQPLWFQSPEQLMNRSHSLELISVHARQHHQRRTGAAANREQRDAERLSIKTGPQFEVEPVADSLSQGPRVEINKA